MSAATQQKADAKTSSSEADKVPAPAAPAPSPATGTTYHVYMDKRTATVVFEWAADRNEDAQLDRLAESIPQCIEEDDLVFLCTTTATGIDNAVKRMLDSQRFGVAGRIASDRVQLVRLVHAAGVDLHFPVASDSYLRTVPVVWESKPTMRIG